MQCNVYIRDDTITFETVQQVAIADLMVGDLLWAASRYHVVSSITLIGVNSYKVTTVRNHTTGELYGKRDRMFSVVRQLN